MDAIATGKLKIDAESETVIDAEFEDVPATWMKLFEGVYIGKLVTKLVD
jgi:NADPH-dependent curcumin reductase CurA